MAEDRKVRQFSLSPAFLADFQGKQPKWGPVGYFTFKRTYARPLSDWDESVDGEGPTEEYVDTCKRVVEGVYNIQKAHCKRLLLPWNEAKAQKSAQDMFRRMWDFKWTPPGRGLWMMGTPFMAEKGGASVNNCAFVSTENLEEDFSSPFTFLMDMSMLGVGVGGDTRGAGKVKIQTPRFDGHFLVQDSREGWVELVRVILNSFVGRGSFPTTIDFSAVRPRGERIRGFGGTASGPEPLVKLVRTLAWLLVPKGVKLQFETTFNHKVEPAEVTFLTIKAEGEGQPYKVTSGLITDVFNMIGACVVAGGVRRSAEILFGDADDSEFRSLKDPTTLNQMYAELGAIQANLASEEARLADEMASAVLDLDPLDEMKLQELKARGAEAERILEPLKVERDEVLQAINDHPLRSHRWASNNSIFGHVGMDYSEVAENIAKNGEPGIMWLKNAQDYGRMGDVPNYKDYRAMGANPCITGDTIIFTGCGPKRADKMIGQPFRALVDGKEYECRTGVFPTGVKPVYLLQTKEGHSIRVTADHQILTASKVTATKRYEVWVEAQDLTPGDKVVLNNVRVLEREQSGSSTPTLLPMEWGEHEGKFDLGWLFGSLLGDGHFKQDQETAKLQFWGPTKQVMLDLALDRIKSLGGDPRYHQRRTGTEVADRDMVSTGSRRLWELAPEFGISFNKEIIGDRVLLESSSFQAGFLRGLFDADGSVQGTSDIGVSVRLWSANRQHISIAQKMLMNLGINSTIYWDRTEAGQRELPNGKGGSSLYECQAGHELIIRKDNLVVFNDRVGFDDPEKRHALQSRLDGYKRGVHRERFLATVESVTYVGIEPVFDCTVDVVHRFGANGVIVHNCVEQTLESYELCTLVETYPAHHDSYEDFQKTLKVAYLYAKTVTLIPTHDLRTNAVMNRNRRIGCSMSGIRQAIAKVGRREFLNWSDRGYGYIQKLDRTYSEWLGVPLSIKTTSVKPSGCRPWGALTATSSGLLTLEEILASHPKDEDWGVVPPKSLEALHSGYISKTFVNGTRPLVVTKLTHGIDLESTPNHQWWVKGKGWQEAQNLVPGDVLEIRPGAYDVATSVELEGDLGEPLRMGPKLAWFLGYSAKGLQPTQNVTAQCARKLQDVLSTHFGVVDKIADTLSGDPRVDITFPSHVLKWVATVNQSLKNSVIPRIVRSSSRQDILAYLAGMLDSSGFVHKDEQGRFYFAWTLDLGQQPQHSDEVFRQHLQHVALAVGLVLTWTRIGQPGDFPATLPVLEAADPEVFEDFLRQSLLVSNTELDLDFYGWHHTSVDDLSLRLGEVVGVEDIGSRPTFDVEVEDSHWYYAGAVKSHNTVSLLCGATPGVHSPHSPFYIRNIRVSEHSPLLQAVREAGYKVEKDAYADATWVVSFPVASHCDKGARDVSIWEQVALAADLQRYWADNQVSVTVTFSKEEAKEIAPVLEVFEDRLKSISFLPLGDDHGYVQAPYIEITEEQYNEMSKDLKPLVLDRTRTEALDMFCDGGACEVDASKPRKS